jgi:transposase
MTMQRVEVLSSVDRRRRWPRMEKERLVAAAFEPGASISDVARSAGLHASQLFRWRKELCQPVNPVSQLLPVTIAPTVDMMQPPPAVPEHDRRRKTGGLIEIELRPGLRVRVDRDVDAQALGRVLDVLTRPSVPPSLGQDT